MSIESTQWRSVDDIRPLTGISTAYDTQRENDLLNSLNNNDDSDSKIPIPSNQNFGSTLDRFGGEIQENE